MTQIMVLLNRGGGALLADPGIGEKVSSAFEESGLDVRVELIDGSDCSARCRAIVERRDDLLVIGGGDGTISAAASVLAGTHTALGVLPLGTLNHFARDLGLPSEIVDAAKLIARRKVRKVDVGEMNGRVFINNSAIGIYPLMVLDRDLQRRRLGRSKRLAMIVASVRTLVRFGHQRLALTVNDQKEQLDTPLLFVGNNEYRLDLGAAGRRESITDGVLSVYVMRKKSRRGFIAASIRALLERQREDDMVRLEHVERLRVTTSRSALPVSLDGEVVHAAPPLDYKIRKGALRVVVP